MPSLLFLRVRRCMVSPDDGLLTACSYLGSVVMAMRPHVWVLSAVNLDQYCSACAGPAPAEGGLKRCPKCKTVRYCNSVSNTSYAACHVTTHIPQECQNRDWAWHKRECDALQKWAATAPSAEHAIPGEAVRCLGRILWGSQKEGLDSPWVSLSLPVVITAPYVVLGAGR